MKQPQSISPTIPSELANKEYVDEQVLETQAQAKFRNTDHLAGEDGAIGDSLFAEVGPTFAEATTDLIIGDASARTRRSIRQISTGV